MHKSEKRPKKVWRILVQIIIWLCTSKISTKVSTKSKQLKKLYGYRKSTGLGLKVGLLKVFLVKFFWFIINPHTPVAQKITNEMVFNVSKVMESSFF